MGLNNLSSNVVYDELIKQLKGSCIYKKTVVDELL